MKRRDLSLLPLLSGAVLALCLAAPSIAHAEQPEKRPVPDYDGRGAPPTKPSRVALWVPRILLSPLYFVSEFVVRRPLGFVVTAAEKAELPSTLYNFFAFGPDHKAGIVPIAFIDFGLSPSVGLYAFWDDAGFDGHDLRLRGSTWGPDWLAGTATERFRFSERRNLTLTATAIRRPDYAFYGIGPDTRESSLSRYASDSVDARVLNQHGFLLSSFIETTAGYRGVSFGPGKFGKDPSLDENVQEGRFEEPPGYREGYRGGFAGARLVLDSRDPKHVSATGARLDVDAEHGTDLGNRPGGAWLRYGGTLGGFWDLTDNGRVVSLALTGLFSDPVGSQPVPFTELVTLGGPGLMPGFREGRLRDRSALVATLRYTWPIWIWLNGSLQAATGNVFGKHLEGMRLERSRFSAALGIEANSSRDSIFQALVGVGSETFESGGELNSLRFTLGARSGF
jgi:hypothetical protein